MKYKVAILLSILLISFLPIVSGQCFDFGLYNSCEDTSSQLNIEYNTYRIDHNTYAVDLQIFSEVNNEIKFQAKLDDKTEDFTATETERTFTITKDYAEEEYKPNLTIENKETGLTTNINLPRFVSTSSSEEFTNYDSVYSATREATIVTRSAERDPVSSISYISRYNDGDNKREVLENNNIPPLTGLSGEVSRFDNLNQDNKDTFITSTNNKTNIGFVIYSPEETSSAELAYNYTLSSPSGESGISANFNVVNSRGDPLTTTTLLDQNGVQKDLLNESVNSGEIYSGKATLSEEEVNFINRKNRLFITLESDYNSHIIIHDIKLRSMR